MNDTNENESENENAQNPIAETMQEVDDIAVENPMLTEFGSSKSDDSDNRLEFVREWFPTKGDWRGKTRISPNQARALTVMRHLMPIYGNDIFDNEEQEAMQNLLDSLATNIEIYQTSMGGKSREEQQAILELAFGGHSEKRESQESSMIDRYMERIDENE